MVEFVASVCLFLFDRFLAQTPFPFPPFLPCLELSDFLCCPPFVVQISCMQTIRLSYGSLGEEEGGEGKIDVFFPFSPSSPLLPLCLLPLSTWTTLLPFKEEKRRQGVVVGVPEKHSHYVPGVACHIHV